MIKFKLKEITNELIKMPYCEMRDVETIIGEVVLDGETKVLNFNRIGYQKLYRCNSDKVYVAIPQGKTRRAFGSDTIYWNKLRKADLYLEKINNSFELIEKYKVLDGVANIISWADKMPLFPNYEVALDSIIPYPIKGN